MDADQFGNRYFEDASESYGRDRWVEYGETRNPDSLKIPPEWHAWLHHNIDVPPPKRPLPKQAFETDAAANPTGTRDAYAPTHSKPNKQYTGYAPEKYEVRSWVDEFIVIWKGEFRVIESMS